jgi:hypothetical protein
MYDATVCGLVYGRNGTPIKTWVTNAGYKQFHQYKDGKRLGVYVHRFVYEYHMGLVPEGLVVDHIDGNKLNNSLDNLQLLSVSDNVIKGKTGKISLEQREKIHLMYNNGKLQREIADVFGIGQPRVSQLLKTHKEKL